MNPNAKYGLSGASSLHCNCNCKHKNMCDTCKKYNNIVTIEPVDIETRGDMGQIEGMLEETDTEPIVYGEASIAPDIVSPTTNGKKGFVKYLPYIGLGVGVYIILRITKLV